jgi:hypothetical protein
VIRHINSIPSEHAARIVELPDGFYWVDPDTGAEFGPFATAALAIADMESSPESDYGPGETLQEAEAELGISDWIDPETGAAAEDSVPRIED